MFWTAQVGSQAEAIAATWCHELFFGGARGGGKSDYILADFLQDVPRYGSAWQGVLFRRTYPELQQLIKRSHEMYPATGGVWYEQAKEWHWSNGACLRMRYLEHPRDASRYQGHEYTWIGWDELTQWATAEAYDMLKACLRSAKDVPTKRIRSSGNPGGAGHHWVKARFIDINILGYTPVFDDETKTWRMFIPSKVTDNLKLLEKDPYYVQRLKGVGSAELVRAWLEGDWSVVTGAYFDIFSSRHILQPFTIPEHWTRFRAFDWGSSRPFCCHWYAVSDGTLNFPANSLICYREWYGGKENVGLKLYVDAVAQGILERQPANEHINYSIADPAIFKQDGGVSIAEQFAKNGIRFAPADNTRLSGWEQVRNRLSGIDDIPMLYFFSTCHDVIRTLPALQHDEKRPEDVDTEGEDHAADTVRYACMSRPFSRPLPKQVEPKTIKNMTFNEIVKRHQLKMSGNLWG